MRKIIIILFITFLTAMLASGWNYPGGNVLLTFDDGPNPYMPQVLAILQENNIKAVFFVVGKEAVQYPDLLREIDRQGHVIGVHTYTHRSITTLSTEEIKQEITTTAKIIKEITGQEPLFFRPPRGKYTNEQIKYIRKMGYISVGWNAGLEKTSITDPQQSVDLLIKRIKKIHNPVILLHDGSPEGYDRTTTVKALPILIRELMDKGYGFTDPKENIWIRQVLI